MVATSGPVDRERLARGCAALERLELDVRVMPHALDADGFLAGRDADRAADLQAAWLDPQVRAVVCARGGYGAQRVLDHLDWAALAVDDPPVLVGSSDITALHDAVGVRLGVTTLCGPMPAGAALGGPAPDPTSLASLRDTLFEPERVQQLWPAEPRAWRPGRADGPVVGGTLTLLAASCGTPECRPAAGGLAVLEDVDEPAYRLDRALTQLLRSGWLDDVRGVVLGGWTGCDETAEELVASRLAGLGVPVLGGLETSHGRVQRTVPLGAVATLDAGAGTLTYAEPALA